jgi:hypothetical protein
MKEGTKPLIFHAIHTTIIFVLMLIALVGGYFLGDIDNGEQYTFFFRNGDYTFLYMIYSWSIIIFFMLIALLCSFFTIPYCVIYWIYCRITHRLDNVKKGLILTIISVLLIVFHPFGTAYISDITERFFNFWPTYFSLVICPIIIITTYITPCLFIRLSYPQLAQIPIYKKYKYLLITQLAVCIFIIAFSLGAFPELREAMKTYIDSRYSRW